MSDIQPTVASGKPPAWKVWVKTARPFTLTATVSPVLVGTTFAAYQGTFHFWIFLTTFFSCLFLQIGTNFFNEYFDYLYGLDHAGSLGASTVIFRNEMTAGQVLGGAIGCFVIAIILGVVLIFLVGPVVILFGVGGMLIAYFYSAKPFKFASRGLGDVMVYLAMGFLVTWGSYFVQIHEWSWQAFAASVPIGFLETAILNMNNVRDYQDDKAVNKKTLPVRFGLKFGQRYHAALLFGSYVAILLFVLVGLLPPLSLLVLITFPLAWVNVRAVLTATERKAFMIGIKRTALLLFQFGLVFSLAFVLAIFVMPHA
ncbi:1,4-dihydroxy-2-naphthoate prenyltransferase [Thermosporothrix hazakensis]|jgi:1,4-dihydroxy-2-naphthoate octaprenyltransferase|uniref:1,4-dihydroxy-2-naphthoate octaprenyltransferase n=2 Tax=Thermosporothrix TaxID=768650 RepID=A0A326UUZ4_THEHA|nr:1,4-dihydroxy-2-naphthoate octaprenyltransferase [Thermosporothrix hazakensis]PZW36393.1 1,4-dihydroxy-2-naphthoate prenyltransferase [Thermosporothrix hazakensis]BBH88858.1 1,4-dihydroxy-2-naphthoate octaprenyltransferase [Thermosporothrix sp. COM3]GCE47043.1 1,4-dihydroxy-2-naphthoate octaprenyltransferase [Thermosporothrix hazakensis]